MSLICMSAFCEVTLKQRDSAVRHKLAQYNYNTHAYIYLIYTRVLNVNFSFGNFEILVKVIFERTNNKVNIDR